MELDSISGAEASRDYARRAYDRIIDWYAVADRKAQLIITLDGAFVSFLVGSAFSEPDQLQAVTAEFGAVTWVLLGLMAAALVSSMACAVASLTSWLYRTKILTADEISDETSAKHRLPGADEVPWFFQHIAALEEEDFAKAVAGVDAAVEAQTLAHNAVRVAWHVSRKHKWVNLGFAYAALAVVLFLGAGISYVVRVT